MLFANNAIAHLMRIAGVATEGVMLAQPFDSNSAVVVNRDRRSILLDGRALVRLLLHGALIRQSEGFTSTKIKARLCRFWRRIHRLLEIRVAQNTPFSPRFRVGRSPRCDFC